MHLESPDEENIYINCGPSFASLTAKTDWPRKLLCIALRIKGSIKELRIYVHR